MEFLLDENVLGLDRYLDVFELRYRRIGDKNCPPLKSTDSEVAKFADKENLVVVTNDDNLRKQCELFEVKYVFSDLTDFAKKIKAYAVSH
jgi:uncharacterized protein YacL